MNEKDANRFSFIAEKFPILVSSVSGIILIIYSLIANINFKETAFNLIIVLIVAFLSSSILKFYLGKKVFYKEEIQEEEENSEEDGTKDDTGDKDEDEDS